jgi:transketolase
MVGQADGHDRPAVAETIRVAIAADRPGLVLLNTVKGRGLPPIEGKIGHYNHGVDGQLHDQLAVELAHRAGRHPAQQRHVTHLPVSANRSRPIIERGHRGSPVRVLCSRRSAASASSSGAACRYQ